MKSVHTYISARVAWRGRPTAAFKRTHTLGASDRHRFVHVRTSTFSTYNVESSRVTFPFFFCQPLHSTQGFERWSGRKIPFPAFNSTTIVPRPKQRTRKRTPIHRRHPRRRRHRRGRRGRRLRGRRRLKPPFVL